MQIRRYYGLAHVRFELPFPTRLPARAISCWELDEGAAILMCSMPRIGTVQWRRSSTLVDERRLLRERSVEEPSAAIDLNSYRQSNVLSTGEELFMTEIHGGAQGGFDEAHAYTIANIFLCLRQKADFGDGQPLRRAYAAMNNVLGIHALLAVDGYVRPLRQSLDTYATASSLAVVPADWPQMTAADLVRKFDQLGFATEIGHGRTMTIGTGSPDDLLQGQFNDSAIAMVVANCQDLFEPAPHQQLALSAIRRLRRREHVGAVIDAQSAVEVCVEGLLRRALLAAGRTEDQVDRDIADVGLGVRIDRLDALSRAKGVERRFGPSAERTAWNRDLASLRHDIVHRGVRDITFEQARRGIAAGLTAMKTLEDNWPDFFPRIRWDGDFLKAEHLKESAGKLYRLFDP